MRALLLLLLVASCGRNDTETDPNVAAVRLPDDTAREQARFDAERRPEKVVEALGIGPGSRVADIGAVRRSGRSVHGGSYLCSGQVRPNLTSQGTLRRTIGPDQAGSYSRLRPVRSFYKSKRRQPISSATARAFSASRSA